MNKTHIAVTAFILLALSLAAFFNTGATPSTAILTRVSGESFISAYRQTANAMLIDVRTPSEFSAGHLAGAVNIDFENPSFAAEIQKLDKATPYFVYCRSGNRSGQATAMMKKEGITQITELQGGIISNQASLILTTETSASTSDYVVDASDMVDGNALIAGTEKSQLTGGEERGLVQMREEEKLAHDVYITLGAKWGIQTFANIASSEQTHTNAIKVLLDKYAITDPSTDSTVGVFHSKEMQTLYDTLVAQGQVSLIEALRVGATIEDLDIRDLETLKKETTKQDILTTYNNLEKGSRNHLRAFVRNLTAHGAEYVPQYITQDMFTSIISSPQERGRI